MADTGASSHMVYDDKYLSDVEEVTDEYITAANAVEFPITKKGKYISQFGIIQISVYLIWVDKS